MEEYSETVEVGQLLCLSISDLELLVYEALS
jgi:hypothetical protein